MIKMNENKYDPKKALHKSKCRCPKFPSGAMFKNINVHTVLSKLF